MWFNGRSYLFNNNRYNKNFWALILYVSHTSDGSVFPCVIIILYSFFLFSIFILMLFSKKCLHGSKYSSIFSMNLLIFVLDLDFLTITFFRVFIDVNFWSLSWISSLMCGGIVHIIFFLLFPLYSICSER